MENNELIRKLVLIDGLSQNAVAKRLGHSKRSVKRALDNPEARQYMLAGPRTSPVADTVRQPGWSKFKPAFCSRRWIMPRPRVVLLEQPALMKWRRQADETVWLGAAGGGTRRVHGKLVLNDRFTPSS